MSVVSPDDLIAALRRTGLRLTAPRRAVCTVLAEAHDEHLTISELHRRAEAVAGVGIDPSTVYRTVDALEGAGEVHHVHLGHGPAVVHLSDHSEHHHIVCEVCGRTEDVPLEELRTFVSHLEERFGFAADSVHFALVGRCSSHRNAS
jgi:Fur family ferric uptake transcriptional regulator